MKMRSRENRKPTSEPRSTTIGVRVSESEKAALKRLAAAAGVSVGAYLLGLALGDAMGQVLIEEVKKDR